MQKKHSGFNEASLERGVRGLVYLLGLATWFVTFLAFSLSELHSLRVTIWLIALFGAWSAGVIISRNIVSVFIQYFSLTLILGTAVIIPEANNDQWIPLTVIALNLVGMIGFRVSHRFAIFGILLTLVGIKFLIDQNFVSFLYGGAKFKDGWISLGYLFTAGMVSYLLKQVSIKQARDFDNSLTSRLEELELRHEKQLKREFNGVIARKLHESILNTFSSIKRIQTNSQLEPLSKVAHNDLASLDNLIQDISPISMQDLIDVSIRRSGIEGTEIRIIPECEIEVSTETLPALQDSLIETFRNIDRHANSTLVTVNWLIENGEIKLIIKDNGKGFSLNSIDPASYGLKVIRNRRLNELGHQVEIESKLGSGTKVEWILKDINDRIRDSDKIESWPRLTQDNLKFRFLSLMVPMYIGIVIIILTSGFENPEIVNLQYFLYLLALTSYVITERLKYRIVLLPILSILILLGQHNLIDQAISCEAALPLQWLVNGYTVGTLVIAMSSIPTLLKSIILISNLVIQANLSSSLRSCQELVFLPALTGLILAIGIIFGLRYLKRSNLETIAQYQDSLNKFIQVESQQNVKDLTYARLQSVTSDSRVLLQKLQSVASTTDLDELRARVTVQESFLRSALIIIDSTTDDAQEALLQMLGQLARKGVLVSIENWTDSLVDVEWPRDLIEFGFNLSDSLMSGTCKLRFINQDYYIYLAVEATGEFGSPLPMAWFVSELNENSVRCEVQLLLITNTFEQIEK